jgi:hypothetical protein
MIVLQQPVFFSHNVAGFCAANDRCKGPHLVALLQGAETQSKRRRRGIQTRAHNDAMQRKLPLLSLTSIDFSTKALFT